MSHWEKHGNVDPGGTTRLFSAVGEVLAHEPATIRQTFVDIHTEVVETGDDGPTFRVHKNSAVDMHLKPTEPKVAVGSEMPVAEVARQLAKDHLKQLASDFQLVGTQALTQASRAVNSVGVAQKYMGGHAYELAEIIRDIADEL